MRLQRRSLHAHGDAAHVHQGFVLGHAAGFEPEAPDARANDVELACGKAREVIRGLRHPGLEFPGFIAEAEGDLSAARNWLEKAVALAPLHDLGPTARQIITKLDLSKQKHAG